MKEFEEWWDKQDVSKYNPGAWSAYEGGWRAALEWITNDCCPEAWDVGDIEFDIQQELEN